MYYNYRSDTSVHTNFTHVRGVAWSTCAGEAVELVNTRSIVLTRTALTLIQLWNQSDFNRWSCDFFVFCLQLVLLLTYTRMNLTVSFVKCLICIFYLCVHVRVRVRVYMHAYMHTCMRVCVCACVCVCMYLASMYILHVCIFYKCVLFASMSWMV